MLDAEHAVSGTLHWHSVVVLHYANSSIVYRTFGRAICRECVRGLIKTGVSKAKNFYERVRNASASLSVAHPFPRSTPVFKLSLKRKSTILFYCTTN